MVDLNLAKSLNFVDIMIPKKKSRLKTNGDGDFLKSHFLILSLAVLFGLAEKK